MLSDRDKTLYEEFQRRCGYLHAHRNEGIDINDLSTHPFGHYTTETFHSLKRSKLNRRCVSVAGFILELVLIGLIIYLYQLPTTVQ